MYAGLTGQREHTHTTHQKNGANEINLELAAEAEMPNQPEETCSLSRPRGL